MNPIGWITDLFPNAYYVARREFSVRVRTRTFAVLTAILGLVGIGLTLLPLGIRVVGGDKPVALAVYSTVSDLSVPAAPTLESTLNATSGGTGGSSPRYRVISVTDSAAAREQVRTDKLDGLLTLTRNPEGTVSFDFFSKESATSQRVGLIRNAANQLADTDQLLRAGVSPAELSRIAAPASFSLTAADPTAARRDEEAFVPSYVLSTIFVVFMFMAIQVYGNWVAMSVGEEKSSRVMELLITAATPRQLLLGKIIGNGAAGLAQYFAVLGAAVAGFLLQGIIAQRLLGETGTSVLGLSPLVLIGFGVFFLSGFFLYSVLYAAAGSMVSRQEDIQQVVGPLTIVGLGGYLLSLAAIGSIDARWVKVLSFVPFVSPFLFPSRMLLTEVAPWEWVLSVSLMLAAILGALWVAARIYEAGVLLYGQRPTLRMMVRAAFAPR
jgi:ABC-2 type transport system permease protein